MQWEQTTLPTTTEPGYGERALPAENLVKSDARPTLVWFFNIEDEKENQSVEASVFSNEKLGLALKRFRCVKIDVESITDARMRREYGSQTPSFRIIDPAGATIATLEGKSASSLSRFRGMVSMAWRKMFALDQGAFVKQMTKILDRLDRVTAQRTVLAAKKQRLEERGQRAKLAALAKDEEELASLVREIEKDEKEIIDGCRLRAAYLEKDDEVAKAR